MAAWVFYHRGTPNWILRDVSFTAQPGEHVAIVGATGAGKTTMWQLSPKGGGGPSDMLTVMEKSDSIPLHSSSPMKTGMYRSTGKSRFAVAFQKPCYYRFR